MTELGVPRVRRRPRCRLPGVASGLGLALATLLAAGPSAALAAEGSEYVTLPQLLELELESLFDVKVITPAKTAQSIGEAPAIVTVFRREDIERLGAVSLIDVLKYAPGIETSMDPDGHWRLALRGLRKDGNVLLLVDGLAFNDFYDGSAVFDLPAAFIERVELVRGPGSALYGSNAVAGVINVFTVQNRRNTQISAGQHQSYDAGLSQQFDSGLSVAAGFARSDGANQPVTVTSQRLASGDTRRYHEDGYLALGYPGERWHFRLLALSRDRGAWAGPVLDLATDSRLRQDQLVAALDYRWRIGENLRLKPKLYLALVDHDFLLNEHPPGYTALGNVFAHGAYTHERYKSHSLGLDTQLEWQARPELGLLAGLVYERNTIADYDLQRNYQVAGLIPQDGFGNHDELAFHQDGRRRAVGAAYVQAQYAWRDFELTLGLRYDDYADFGGALSPRLGLVYGASPALRFKLLYAEAFRAPTFKELYDDTRIGNNGVAGNRELKPETIDTVELGFEYSAAPWILRGNVFQNRTRDQIAVFDPQGAGARGRYDNIGEIDGLGGEAELAWQFGEPGEIFLNVSRFENEFAWGPGARFALARSYLAERGEERLLHTPRIRANLGLRLGWGAWSAQLGVGYGGRAAANNRSVLEGFRAFREQRVLMEKYWQGDVNLRYAFTPGMSVELAGANLGATKHSDPEDSHLIDVFGADGLAQPGETWLLRWRWQR